MAVSAVPWGGVSPLGGAEGKSGGGRSLDAGSCAHDAADTAEVCSVAGGGLHQRQERDPFGSGVWRAQAELRGAEFLGARLLRLEGGT